MYQKKLYFDKRLELEKYYNNTICGSIKMKPTDVKPHIYIDFVVKFNRKKAYLRSYMTYAWISK